MTGPRVVLWFVPSLVALVLGAGGASAAFAPPKVLVEGGYGVGAAAATDAAGETTVVARGQTGGLKLLASDAAPGSSATALGAGATGPVVGAAGDGAAAAAWRVDTPRRYEAIAALVRDPGQAFGSPLVVSDADANGVRHPSIAVAASGGVVLAYNTNTREQHLSMRGAVAVALRGSGRPFAAPVVVDEQPAQAPVAAVGADGKGVVAWLRDRRVWAVAVDVEAGTVGVARAVLSTASYDGLQVAAGPGTAATIAATRETLGGRGRAHVTRRVVVALRRPPGGAFAGRRPQVVATLGSRDYLNSLALAADEDGRATLVFGPQDFGNDRSKGVNGVVSGVRITTAETPSGAFGPVRDLLPRGDALCSGLSVAAVAGRSAAAFTCRTRRTITAYGAVSGRSALGRPTAFATTSDLPSAYVGESTLHAGLDRDGTATIVGTWPIHDPAGPPGAVIEQVLSTTGR